MKILVIGLSDNPGGIESFIKVYFNKLKDRHNFDFMVFTEKCVDYNFYKNHGSNIYFIKHAQFKEPTLYRKEIKKFFLLHQNEYDAIWFNCCDLANISVIMKYAKKFDIQKRIIHAHNSKLMHTGKRFYFYKFLHSFNKIKIKYLATDYWACSKLAAEFFYNFTDYQIINNAIEVENYAYNEEIRTQYRKKLNIEDKFVIGHVGRFHMQKNHLFLIEVFKEIALRKENSVLLLVGQGELENKIKEKVKSYNLEDKVIFLGVREDINILLNVMDSFVFPSVFEGLAIALLEAQANGLICFTSDKVIPKEVNITGLVNFISLNEEAKMWAEQIITKSILNTNRYEKYNSIFKSIYNIDNATLLIEEKFSE